MLQSAAGKYHSTIDECHIEKVKQINFLGDTLICLQIICAFVFFNLGAWLEGNCTRDTTYKHLLALSSYFGHLFRESVSYTRVPSPCWVAVERDDSRWAKERRPAMFLGHHSGAAAAARNQHLWTESTDAGSGNQPKTPCCIQQTA